MSLASMLWIPGYAIYYIATQRGSLRDVSKDSKRSLIRDNMNEKIIICKPYFCFQRVIKGITPDIKSARVKAPPKKMKQNLSGTSYQQWTRELFKL